MIAIKFHRWPEAHEGVQSYLLPQRSQCLLLVLIMQMKFFSNSLSLDLAAGKPYHVSQEAVIILRTAMLTLLLVNTHIIHSISVGKKATLYHIFFTVFHDQNNSIKANIFKAQ